MRRFADYFFGRVAGHLREGRADVNNMRAWRVELRRHNDDRFITLLNRRFEQPQLRFGLIVKSSLLACDDRAPRAGAGPGDSPRFLALLAPGVLTPQGVEVGFKHALLLNQLTLTRHVPRRRRSAFSTAWLTARRSSAPLARSFSRQSCAPLFIASTANRVSFASTSMTTAQAGDPSSEASFLSTSNTCKFGKSPLRIRQSGIPARHNSIALAPLSTSITT